MNSNYSKNIEKFLNLSIDDLKKMKTNALSERQLAEVDWKKVAKVFFRKHYLIDENESLAYCPIYARILYIEVQRNLKSNKPYTSQIIRDPNNALSPIFDILDELKQERVGFKGEDKDLSKYREFIESLRKATDKSIASNPVLADIFQKAYYEITLFANSCIKREMIDIKTCEYKCEHVPLNEIAIYKNNATNDAVYFFRDIKMDLTEFKFFFTEDYSLKQVLSYYTTLNQPENQFKKDIRITECSYYCIESGKTIIRYFLEKESYSDLEEIPRIKNYQVFWFFQVNGENSIYGSIDDKDYQIFMDLERKQMLYKNLEDVKSKIEKSRTLDVISLIQEKPLESNFDDGVKAHQSISKYNLNNVKNITILPQQVEAFGGNLRNQNLEDPENIQRYATLEAIHYKNIEEFANNLNFDEAQKKMLIPLAERKDTTATEFKELLFASTTDKRKLEILENFTGSFYGFMIQFIVGNYAEKITEYDLKSKGKASEYIGIDYDEYIDEAFFDILKLDLNLTDEELKNNPFSFYVNNERVSQVKEAYNNLVQIYNEAQNDIDRNEAMNGILMFQKEWNNEIQNDFIPILKAFKDKKENAITEDDFGDVAVISSSKEFVSFILNFRQYSKKIKFKLASAEANILQNQENQNWLKLINTVIGLTSQIGDPELTRELIILSNIKKGVEDIGISLNLETKLNLGKKLEEEYEKDKMARVQMQQQLQAQVNNQ